MKEHTIPVLILTRVWRVAAMITNACRRNSGARWCSVRVAS